MREYWFKRFVNNTLALLIVMMLVLFVTIIGVAIVGMPAIIVSCFLGETAGIITLIVWMVVWAGVIITKEYD